MLEKQSKVVIPGLVLVDAVFRSSLLKVDCHLT